MVGIVGIFVPVTMFLLICLMLRLPVLLLGSTVLLLFWHIGWS